MGVPTIKLNFKQPAVAASGIAMLLAFCMSGPVSADSVLLDEVIVTAQKREQSVQDVSVSVTAFSGDQLKSLGFESQTQVVSQSPGVSLLDFGPTTAIRIRGIGTSAFSENVESPAAIYRDDVYRPTLPAATAQMFDVERVEILRGPQGTLFGRNTNAGLIHVISKAPTDDFESYAELQIGNYGQYIFEGAVSGPISDSVRGRLSAKNNKDDGYITNLGSGGGNHFGETDIIAIRGQLEFDLGDTAGLLLTASHTKERSTNVIYNGRGTIDVTDFTPCSADRVLDQACNTLDTAFRYTDDYEIGYSEQSDLPKEMDVTDFSARLTWDISDSITLASITSYEEFDRFLAEEVDISDVGFFGFQIDNTYFTESTTFTQELRLSGDTDSVKWVFGGYYFDDDKDRVDSFLASFGLDTLADVTTESYALFGQADFAVTDSVSLIAGLRYTEDDREANVEALFAVPPDDRATFKVSADAVTYKLAVEWRPNDDLLVYASTSTGFKSPEFNLTLQGLDANGAAPIAEEEVTSYEIGTKWTFADGRARLNAAVFYNEVKDFQGSTYAGFTNTYLNIGDADIVGGELELTARPNDNLELLLGVAYVDSEVSSTGTTDAGPLVPPALLFGTTFPLDGTRLTGTPKLAVNGLIRYNFPIKTAGEFAAQVDFNWQDDVFWDISNNPYDVQEAYAIYNLRFFWEHPDAKFFAQAFINNVENKYYDNSALTVAGLDRQIVIPGKPRTYGVRLGIRF